MESERAEFKRSLWRDVGVEVVTTPGEIGRVMKVSLEEASVGRGEDGGKLMLFPCRVC